MGCPAGVGGAAYSAQPFGVTVKPMNARRRAVLHNYNGVLARPITLSAWSQAGGAAPNPAGGVPDGQHHRGGGDRGRTSRSAPSRCTALPQPFSNSAPRARNWTAPTAVYLRAGAERERAPAARRTRQFAARRRPASKAA